MLLAAVLLLAGCASAMSHSGSTDISYYPGTHASYQMLNNQQTSWMIKPFIILDMPFTIMLDTLLLPWDHWHQQQSLKSQLERLEKVGNETSSH